MGRKFAPHDLELLKTKLQSLKNEDGDPIFENQGHFMSFDPYALPEKVRKDIGKVEFDFENYEFEPDNAYAGSGPIVGWRTHENGLPYFGVIAGGDWELPVFFIVYWDGKELRGYVPTDGNTWNTDTKKAYGNGENGEDGINMKKRWPEEFDEREASELETDSCPDCDPAKILVDIGNRIQVRS
jgi:hypothetical protein